MRILLKFAKKSIKNLNLVELNASHNKRIRDISFMTNLRILKARDCGIDQNSIKGLNLVYLDATKNNKICDVSFMTNLQVLYAGCHSL